MTTLAREPVHLDAPRRSAARSMTPWLIASLALLAVAVILSLCLGARSIGLDTVWNALFHFDPSDAEQGIIRESRVVRTMIGIIAGAGLALAGALTQTVTRNPLADPGLLGINAGSALAIVVGITVFGIQSFSSQLWLAFLGAGLAGIAVFAIGGRGAGMSSPVRLALGGAALTAVLGSITTALLLLNPDALNSFRFWLAGSLIARSEAPFGPLAVVGVIAVAMTAIVTRSLNALALGDDSAASLGTRPGRTRALVMVAVTLLAGLATALAGPIAFIGLAVPHLVRGVTKARLGWLFALSLPVGAATILLCDVFGRLVARPGEVAVGVTTALLGGALLAFMARRLTAVTL
jgi:iron complex transport system permease protein